MGETTKDVRLHVTLDDGEHLFLPGEAVTLDARKADALIREGYATGSEGAVQEARYRLATEPTPYLYVQTAYAYSDASNAIIREMGLFMDTEFVEGLPEGQRYFVPDDLKNPGLLLAAQIILPHRLLGGCIGRHPATAHVRLKSLEGLGSRHRTRQLLGGFHAQHARQLLRQLQRIEKLRENPLPRRLHAARRK